ncbi:transcriptional regulator, AsnC family [Ostertagia ostertagi]
MFGRKGDVIASLLSHTRQTRINDCRSMKVLDEQVTDYEGEDCYLFQAIPKPEYRSEVVYNELSTWFRKTDYSIVARDYSLSYKAGVYDFDVRMKVRLLQVADVEKRIEVLQEDARLNTKEIAGKVGLSVTPTYERLKKIEKSGLHSLPLLKKFEAAMLDIREVMECHHVAGTYDYLLKVVVKDMHEYQDFLTNKLAAIENIATVHSVFVMTEIKHNTVYQID